METQTIDSKIYVLDTGVFLSPRNQNYLDKLCMTTHHVVGELKTMEAQITLDIFLKQGLIITEPSDDVVEKVKKLAEENHEKVSMADISVVALARELKERGKQVVVVSDDYAVQNLCSFFGIDYAGVEKKGIKNTFRWINKCAVCGNKTSADVCEHCGSDNFKFVPLRT